MLPLAVCLCDVLVVVTHERIACISCFTLWIHTYRVKAVAAKKESAFTSQAYKDNPSRYNVIQFVKSFIISQACPFSIGDNPHVRHCLSLMCPDDLDVKCLNNNGVRFIFSRVVRLL